MKLYHFTSLENYEGIKESGLKLNTVINGKNVLMLTKQAERRQQLWAIGEHRGKTDVRLTINAKHYKELELPKDIDERCRLVQMGAVSAAGLADEGEVFGITGKSVRSYYREDGIMNWLYAYGLIWSMPIYKSEIWNEKIRRYVQEKLTPEEEKEEVLSRLHERCEFDPSKELSESYWYQHRWNEFYWDKIAELDKLILSNKTKNSSG